MVNVYTLPRNQAQWWNGQLWRETQRQYGNLQRVQSKTQRQIKEIPVVPPANILSCAKAVRYQIVKCVYFQTFLQISWGIVWGIVYFKFYPRGFSFSTFGYRYFKLITIFTGKYKLLEPQKRPHNPEVVGSSPASATIKTPDFDKKSGVFLTFSAIFKIWLSG